MGRALRHAHLHGDRQVLALGRVGLVGEGGAQLQELVVQRPAEPGILADRVDVGVDQRIDDVDRGGRRQEGVPATLVGRVLAGAAADQGLDRKSVV